MAKFEKQRQVSAVMDEARLEEKKEHDEALARHSAHLCIHGWRDVLWITGAIGAGLLLGKLGESQLKGKWRAVPMVVGVVLSIAARRTDPQQTRFATKAAMVVGGFALITSTVHFTMQARIDADRSLEA